MNCVVCNSSFLKDNTSFDIFYTPTTHTNTLIINFIKKTFNWDVNECHSRYLCQLCFGLFEELDYAELSCSRLKRQLTERGILNKYNYYLKDNSTQTTEDNDLLENISNNLLLDSIKSETNVKSYESEITRNIENEVSSKKLKSYECGFCQKKFCSKSGLKLHTQRLHQDVKKEDEEDLEKVDDSIKQEYDFDLDEHFKSDPDQSDSNDINEDITISTSTKKNVRLKTAKQKAVAVVKPLKYTCSQCPKMWRTLGELRNHVATHSSLRPFICEICGQAYKHKQALDIHIGMHNGINPFCCQYCNKAFTQKGALQRHLPIHTGEAPFQCDLCGKRFVHHTSFNMHTLAHSKQKSYKCNVCGLALLSCSHLKRHMRVHTGERPYACSHCGKRFAERYNLAAHQRLHEAGPSELTRQRLHRCQVCGSGFDRRTKLEEHLANNHNKITDSEENRKWVGHLLTTDA